MPRPTPMYFISGSSGGAWTRIFGVNGGLGELIGDSVTGIMS